MIGKFADRPTNMAKLAEAFFPRQRSRQRQVFDLSGLALTVGTNRETELRQMQCCILAGWPQLDDSLARAFAHAATHTLVRQIPESMRSSANAKDVDLETTVDHFRD